MFVLLLLLLSSSWLRILTRLVSTGNMILFLPRTQVRTKARTHTHINTHDRIKAGVFAITELISKSGLVNL
jgi:hypothetical protein